MYAMGTNPIYLYSNPCRLCLNDDEFQLPIFEEYGRKKKVFFKIQACLPIIKVTENDGLPNNICYKCLSTLDILYEFWQKCCSSETILRSRSYNSYNMKSHQKTGYHQLGGIQYPPSAHYRMKFPRSVSQSTHIHFADTDSEDDWPILNSMKRSKMCIAKSKQIAKQSNDNRLCNTELHHNRDLLQPGTDDGGQENESKWKKLNETTKKDGMETSLDLLEIIDGDSESSNEIDETPVVERKGPMMFHSNNSRFKTMSSIEDKHFVANFWKQSNADSHNQPTETQQNHVTGNVMAQSPKTKVPSVDRQVYKPQEMKQESSNEKKVHCEATTNKTLLHNNLVIPNAWLSDATQHQSKVNFSSKDAAEKNKEENIQNRDDISKHSALEENKSLLNKGIQKESETVKGSDISYLLMNLSKNFEGQAMIRTKNLLERFKACQQDLK